MDVGRAGHRAEPAHADVRVPAASPGTNAPAARRRVADAATAAGGRPFRVVYQLHSREHGIGLQRVRNLHVEYGRRPDGTWQVVHAEPFPPDVAVPGLNRIIDLRGLTALDGATTALHTPVTSR